MLNIADEIQGNDFNENEVDGSVEVVNAQSDEDMIVAVCHIAECITFGKQIDVENIDLKLERQRILSNFISLLHFT